MALTANVRIETGLREERTVLQKSFCQPPFRLADVTENKTGRQLRLMLMSSSPGVLDGDEYDFLIRLAEKTSLSLQTQSYQRLFQMKKGAVQNATVHLDEGASFIYLPHPVVPHKASRFTARTQIFLAGNCTLTWGEVISCGRKLNDEVFQFSSYHSLTEIFLHGRLAVKENLLLIPAERPVNVLGQMEGFTHGATFLHLNESVDVTEVVEWVLRELQPHEDIAFGVSALPVNGFIVRLLGHKAEQLFDLLKHLQSSLFKTDSPSPSKNAAYV